MANTAFATCNQRLIDDSLRGSSTRQSAAGSLALLCLLSLGACSGGSNPAEGAASVQGSVNGISLANAADVDSVLLDTDAACNPQTGNEQLILQVSIASRGDYCTAIASNTITNDNTQLGFVISRQFGGSGNTTLTPPAITSGTYVIGASEPDANGFVTTTSGEFLQTDASCSAVIFTSEFFANSGTVSITNLSPGIVVGSFNATFGAGSVMGNLSGTFSTIGCQYTAEQYCSGATASCTSN